MHTSVVGLSLLRQHEKKDKPQSEKAKALQEYLKKYAGGDAPKKKKKKKKQDQNSETAVRIIDEDISGFASIRQQNDEEEEDVPVIVNPEEAAHAEKLAKSAANYGKTWQTVDDDPNDKPAERRARHDSPDFSPPRLNQQLAEDASLARRRRHDSPDYSPPRKARNASFDMSPPRRGRHDSSDASPPRQTKGSGDALPPHGKRHDSPDLSPPRKARQPTADASPPRRKRHDSPDLSPPRKARQAGKASSPHRKRQDSADLSPPRKARQAGGDASPSRRRRHDRPDQSPPRRGAKQVEGDASPPRRKGEGPARKHRHDSDPEDASPKQETTTGQEVMADGLQAGIVSGKDLMEDLRRKRELERRRFEGMDASVTGRGAKTVYRNRDGKAVDPVELQPAKKKKKVEMETEQQLEWGGGLAQRKRREEMQQQMQEEAAKPFARYRDDADLDREQRDRLRWGDPMAHLVRNRLPEVTEPKAVLEGERGKKSGFIVPQEVPAHSWIRRNIGPAPNRYGIKPGRHWDGVDRSNGFERDLFKHQNNKAFREQESYVYATADM